MSDLKAIKGGKVTDQFDERKVTLRGVEYTIRDIDVNQYDEAMKAAELPDGSVPFGKLLRAMTTMAVRPLPKTPWPYPIYRTLEAIVNEMHFVDVKDDNATPEKTDGEGESGTPEEAAPNA